MSERITSNIIKKKLRRERVMLVGGGGFIGHNLALELRDYGIEVMVVDNLMVNNLVTNVSEHDLDPLRRALNHGFLMDRFEMMRDAGVVMRNVDARTMGDLTEAFHDFSPTKIIHLSAIASSVEARKAPGHCFDLQLITLRNVLELCRIYRKVNQVVLFSSSTVYGDFETPTVDETVRPRPRGIYANTKFMAERLVRTYAHQYGTGSTIVRPSALYGERCVSRRVSQTFIENALLGKPLLLEGGGDGRLDFTYIQDLTDGIARTLAAHQGPGTTNTFNLTFGGARSIAELAAIVKSVVPDTIIENRPRDVEKPLRGTLSTKRAEEELGFKPQWPLEKGYKQYCEWYVGQFERARKTLKSD